MEEKNISLPAMLSNFDKLPDAAHVRQPVVMALYGCSSATMWRWVKSGTIPTPHKFLGKRITAWNVGELRASLSHTSTKGTLK